MDGPRVCSVGLEPPPISCLTRLTGDSNYIRTVWQESNLAPEGGVKWPMQIHPAPKGFRWVYCRYRRVRNSERVLDAHDYGYEAWRFLVRC